MPASKIATVNEVSSTTIPELVIGQVWRSLLGSFRGVHVPVPGRAGAWFSGQKRGTRELRWSCFVLAEDFEARRAAVVSVSDWLDWDEDVKITLSDMPGKYYMGTLSDPPDPEEWREAGVFELVFIIQPYAFDDNITNENWTSDSDDNHTWSPTLLAPVYPLISITPTNGTLLNFTLESNGDTLVFVGDIASGSTVTINAMVPIVVSGIGNVALDEALTGAFDPSTALLTGVSGSFPVLMPNIVNNVHFVKQAGTATSFTISVNYRKVYRD